MSQIEEIKKLITPTLTNLNTILYDVKWKNENRNKVLEISITRDDGTMDLDTCALVSDSISDVLDTIIDTNYMLEVCSPGAEREVKNLDEIKNLVGKYVYVRSKHSIKGNLEFTGEIIEASDTDFKIAFREKAVLKKVVINLDEIDFIRLAVKL